MTTPAKLRPGQVSGHEEWVVPRIPANLRLPPWVDRNVFLPGLYDALETYESTMTAARLSARVQEERQVAIAWLNDALKDLKRGSTARLRDHPGARMPGDSAHACWAQAHKMGLLWEELVATDVSDPARGAAIADIVEKAITAMKEDRARRGPRPRGRKPMTPRNQLLAAVAAQLQQFRIPDDDIADRWHKVTKKRAAEEADAILVGCGVPSASREQNAGSRKRAVSKGRQHP